MKLERRAEVAEPAGGWYPDSGFWAVAARIGLVLAAIAIAYASLAPGRYVPRLLYSYHLEHFAAFYVLCLMATAAFPRAQLRALGLACMLIAAMLEGGQVVMAGRAGIEAYQNWLADVGGAFAAVLPIAVGRFRRLFRPKP